jgi:hypothetical protein
MKVIFLDIDGVLQVHHNNKDEYGHLFHDEYVKNLKYIIEKTGAKIVISSTWKMSGLNILKEMWNKRNLPGEVIDITPNEVDVVERGTCEYYDMVDRGYEIQQWIDDNKPDKWVIVDDVNDMLPEQINNFVQTSNLKDDDSFNGYGLTKKCSEKIINILMRNDKIDILIDWIEDKKDEIRNTPWVTNDITYFSVVMNILNEVENKCKELK